MITVEQYTLSPPFRVRTHAGAKPIGVFQMHRRLCVMCEVDTEQPLIDKQFTVVGVNHIVPPEAVNLIGTVVMDPLDELAVALAIYEDA